MHAKREVIDVDERIVLDLTKDIHIDLTDENDIAEVSLSRFLPQPPHRTKVSHRPTARLTTVQRPGPSSSINIRTPYTALNSLSCLPSQISQPPLKKRKVESDRFIIIDDDNISLLNCSKPSQLADEAIKRFIELDSDGEDIENQRKVSPLTNQPTRKYSSFCRNKDRKRTKQTRRRPICGAMQGMTSITRTLYVVTQQHPCIFLTLHSGSLQRSIKRR